jgi:4-carboxymuconolactone decarboxylase
MPAAPDTLAPRPAADAPAHPEPTAGERGRVVPEAAVLQLARIAAAVAVAPIDTVHAVMTDARDLVDPAHVDEVLLQSYLFAGFPRTLNAMGAWRELSGIPAPRSDDASSVEHAPRWTRLGEATCRAVYGPTYDALRHHVARLHPALDAWMLVDGYGKVLSRPTLPLVVRERCIVAVCAAADQRPQLGSHLRGARRCGATTDQLSATLHAIADLAAPAALAAARAELERIVTAQSPAPAAPAANAKGDS